MLCTEPLTAYRMAAEGQGDRSFKAHEKLARLPQVSPLPHSPPQTGIEGSALCSREVHLQEAAPPLCASLSLTTQSRALLRSLARLWNTGTLKDSRPCSENMQGGV